MAPLERSSKSVYIHQGTRGFGIQPGLDELALQMLAPGMPQNFQGWPAFAYTRSGPSAHQVLLTRREKESCGSTFPADESLYRGDAMPIVLGGPVSVMMYVVKHFAADLKASARGQQ